MGGFFFLKKGLILNASNCFQKSSDRVTITIVFHLSFNRFNRLYTISEACKFETSFVIMHLILFSVWQGLQVGQINLSIHSSIHHRANTLVYSLNFLTAEQRHPAVMHAECHLALSAIIMTPLNKICFICINGYLTHVLCYLLKC